MAGRQILDHDLLTNETMEDYGANTKGVIFKKTTLCGFVCLIRFWRTFVINGGFGCEVV